METLVVVAQHRNQYCNWIESHGPDRFGSSPSSRKFREINWQNFQSEAGILPTPLKACSAPVTKWVPSSSPKTPSHCANSHSNGNTHFKTVKSSPIPIKINGFNGERSFNEELSDDNLSFSERWAGPAYSNSPPPSSLPIPKFSLRPKRTVSLDFPVLVSEIKVHPIAKSAPASPAREYSLSPKDLFDSSDSATKTLCRILNLDFNK